MIIRSIEQRDIAQHNMVSSSAFIWKVDEKIDNELPKNPTIGAFKDDDKTLMAELECMDFRSYFGNGTLGGVGIGGVATKPEYRRAHCIRALFDRVECISRENGWDIGILYPFSIAYYRLFGYETVTNHVIAKIPFKYFSHIDRNSSVEILTELNLDKMLTLYNEIASRYNLAFERKDDRYFCVKPYETCVYTYMWKDASDTPRAYARYTVDREQSTVDVQEIGFLDKQSLLGILGFLRCYDGNNEYIRFAKLPVNSPIFDMTPEECKFDRQLKTTGSARIYNFSAVLEKTIYPLEHGHFSLRIDDKMKENAGVYDVEYENGIGCVKKRTDGEFDIAMNVPCASKLLLSGTERSYDDLRYLSGIEIVNENRDFLRAFSKRNTYFTDGF